METAQVRALYYPYSRCFSEVTLKRALLVYDQIVFVDPVHRDISDWSSGSKILPEDSLHIWYRTSSTAERPEWRVVRDTYSYLREQGAVALYDPKTIIQNNADALLASYNAPIQPAPLLSRYSSINDDPGMGMVWVLPESRIPRGTHTSVLNLFPTSREPRRLGEETSDLHTEPTTGPLVALGVNDAFRLLLDQALMICEAESLVPLTDDSAAYSYLGDRCRLLSKAPRSLYSNTAPTTDLIKLGQLTLMTVARTIPDEIIAARSFAEIMRYRSEAREPLARFRSWLRRLTFGLEDLPSSDAEEDQLGKLLETVIVPELEKVDDQLKQLWAKMFTDVSGRLGEAALRAVAASAPSLTIGAAAGLTPGLLVAMAAASFFSSVGMSLPSVSSYINARREAKCSFGYFLWKLQASSRGPAALRTRSLYALTPTQTAVLQALANSRKALDCRELVSLTFKSIDSIEVALLLLIKKGLVYEVREAETVAYFTALDPNAVT